MKVVPVNFVLLLMINSVIYTFTYLLETIKKKSRSENNKIRFGSVGGTPPNTS